MIASKKWISDYAPIMNIDTHTFTEAITVSGSKVEGWECAGDEIENVVIGRVTAIEKHPDSDHLNICQVDVGKETVQIVTGAQNVFAGAVVPVALDNSSLPGGKKIKAGKLRGVDSNGMLCSLGELGLSLADFPYAIEDGIFIIDTDQEKVTIGQNAVEALGLDDTAIEFEITSNRPDCLSVRGLAREAAATFNVPYAEYQAKPVPAVDQLDGLTVEIRNPERCSRYIARKVSNVRIAPSPRWMRERLRACGVRPINNLVDITNYVMLEFGHPMHAFDLRYLNGAKIVVRSAGNGETITTLDGVSRSLCDRDLVICDAEKPVAVAGIMGGEYSGIMDDTTDVIFEAACFEPGNLRLTAKRLGLRSESSARFEKGLDPNQAELAMARACELVELLGCGTVHDGKIDLYPAPLKPWTLPFNPAKINAFLGSEIPEEEMIRSLAALNIPVKDGQALIPTNRADLGCFADLAEEVARMYGYDKLPVSRLTLKATGAGMTAYQKFARKLRRTLIDMGLYECYTYSFGSHNVFDKLCLPQDHPLRDCITISNPLGEDSSAMRTTMIPSLLGSLSNNLAARTTSAALFDIGKVYRKRADSELPDEPEELAIGLYGDQVNFYTVKGVVETLFDALGISYADYTALTDCPYLHPGRAAAILSGSKQQIGVVGELHPTVTKNFELEGRVGIAVLDMKTLFELSKSRFKYKKLPTVPSVNRDIALVCDENVTVASILRLIKKACGHLLENVRLFDVYRGERLGEGKKSVAFSLTFRGETTLTDAEIDPLMKKLVSIADDAGLKLR